MRAYLPSFEMRRARTLDEALALLAQRPAAWRPFAGGTDLMVLLAAGSLRHQRFVSIWGIDELRRIDPSPDFVGVGALATFTDILRSDVLRTEFPLLGLAAREIGGIANQNRSTIGGNIANASPAADSPPALLVYDAEVELASARGRRRVPYAQFHMGYKQMDLRGDELIAKIWLPRRPFDAATRWVQEYRKVGARRAQAISKVCFAGRVEIRGGRAIEARLAFGSVGPTVVRASTAEETLRGAELTPALVESAARSLASDLAPIDDIRSTARYRQRVAENLLRRFLLAQMM
ncbi:MAG: FAD binding domain-containing protein [Vicinamibacterales bacterium]